MSGTMETAMPIVKPNAVTTFSTAPYFTSMVPIPKSKLDDVKSLMKYLSQPTIDFINSLTEQLAGEDADDDDGGHDDYNMRLAYLVCFVQFIKMSLCFCFTLHNLYYIILSN